MAKQTNTAATDIQNLFDPRGYQDMMKTFANMNERMTQVAFEAGTRSTDIAHETTKEAVSNLRNVMQMREDPADYGKAYSDFFQKQMDLTVRAAQSFADVTQKAGSDASELTSKAGEDFADKATANAQSAAQTATSAAKKAS